MGTVIRAEIKKSNPYYISRHRYYELKHYCLQYKEWKHAVLLEQCKSVTEELPGELATQLVYYDSAMEQVESCCKDAGGDISSWLFTAVTEGKSYAVLVPPCSKEYFYQRYRKFFYLLDKIH